MRDRIGLPGEKPQGNTTWRKEMKKLSIMLLLGVLTLSLLTGAYAQEATQAPEAAITQEPAAQSVLDITLSGGKTFGELTDELGVLDAFQAADARAQVQMIRAMFLLGKLTREDVQEVLSAVITAAGASAGVGKGPLYGNDVPENNNRRDKRQNRNDRQTQRQDRDPQGQGQGRMPQGQDRDPQGQGNRTPNYRHHRNCPFFGTQPNPTPEAAPETVNP